MIDKEKLNELRKTKENLRLRNIAIGVAGVAIALMISCVFFMDQISWRTYHLIRGCIGLFAIIIVIIVAVIEYRVHRTYFRQNTLHKK